MGLQIYWLYITTFLDLVATSLLVPFLPLHLQSCGLPRVVVGVISSVYPSVQLFSSPVVGFYSDRYGQKFTLIISLLISSLAYYLLASTTSLLAIFFCRLVLGLVKHTQTICKAVFLSKNETFPKTFGFGVLSAAEAFGFMVGPMVGAYYIGCQDGFRYLCKITTTLFIVNAIIVYFFLPEEKVLINCYKQNDCKVIGVCKSEYSVDWALFWDILALKLLLCVSLSLFYLNYATLVVDHLQESPNMVGYTNSYQGLICAVSSLFSNKVLSSHYLKNSYVKFSIFFMLLSFSHLCMLLVYNFLLFILILIPLNFASTLLRINLTEVLVSRSNSSDKGSIIGVENTIATISGVISPFIFECFSFIFGSVSIFCVPFLLSGFGAVISTILSLQVESSYSNKDN